MARKWVLVLLGTVLAAVRTGGRSTGAPDDACDTFTPMHYGNSAQSGDGGFKLYSDLIDNGGSYEGGQEYNITLRNEDGTTAFKGFLIGARRAATGVRVGTFSTPTGSQLLDCAQLGTDTSTVTHTNNSDKQSVMFTWTAPGLSGTVEFRYAVVINYTTFYADLEPSMATQPAPSFSIQFSGTFSFNIPSTSTNPVPQPTPAVMVPDCPATDKMADSEFPLTFGQPAGCDRESCEVYAAMGPNAANPNFLDIYLEGTANGWVAVGFSKDTHMNSTDVVGCRIISGEVNVRDAWNPGQYNQDDEFPEYGVCTHSANYTGGRISCLISKYGMKVEDTQDFNLTDGSYWIITGIRTNGQFINGRFLQHTSVPTFSTAQYNPFSDNNADVVIVTDPPIVCPAAPEADRDYNIEVRIPSGCTKDDCTYYAAMGPNADDGEFLDVYLQGTVEGWVAVGFSLDQMMGGSDVLGCKVVNDTASVVDSWNILYINVLDGDQEGVCVHSASYSNGVFSCLFSRHGAPGTDSDDLQLNADLWLLFGARTEAQLAIVPGLRKHTSTPFISDQMYNPFTSEVALSFTTPTTAPFTCPSAPNQDYNLEFGLPQGCTKDDCTYYVAMGPNAEDDKFLDVYLQGTADGWVAVGFSHTKSMGDSDVLGCKVVDDVVSVVDTWNVQAYNTLDGDQEGLCVYSSSYSNGVISCSFSRLGGDGSDSEDLPLNDDLWLMFGSRTDAQASVVEGLSKHLSTPVLSDKEYNPFTSKTEITPVPMTITCPSAPASDAVYPVETTFDDFYFAARINDENPNFLDMIIQASTEGWIAIGFSTTRQMAETDVFACQVEPSGSVVNVKDGWNPLPNYAANQLDSTQQGICKHDATYRDGTIRCTFSRYISALNSETDLNLNHSLYRMYAKGNTKDMATSSLARHESTPAVTDDTANIVTAAATGENVQESVYPVVELIKTHGILMLFSWPLLATNAIFFASWLKPALPNGEWFKVHRAVMIISLVTTLAGFIFAFVANAKKSVPGLIEFDSSGVNTTHFVFGIIITLLHIVNPIIALFRCKPGTKWRWIFNVSHAGIIGFGAQILALVNVCLGLWLLEQSHYGFYVFIVFFVLFLVMEVTMFILTSFLATRKGVPKKEIPNLVHSSVKFFLPKSEPAPETTVNEDVEMEEKNEKPPIPDEDSEQEEQKQKKKPSSDARIRWASFGLFLGMSVVVFIVVVILVLLD